MNAFKYRAHPGQWIGILSSIALSAIAHAQPRIPIPPIPKPDVPPIAALLNTDVASLSPEIRKKLAVLADLQNVPPGRMPRDSSPALEREVSAKAKDKIRSNDLEAAEDLFTAVNPFGSDTHQWHLYTAQQWLGAADDVSKEADRGKVPALVTRTLQHLDEAAKLARAKGDSRAEAAAKTNTAFIHERFRGDPSAAIAGYRAALRLDPKDQTARESLDRLEASLAILQARVRARK